MKTNFFTISFVYINNENMNLFIIRVSSLTIINQHQPRHQQPHHQVQFSCLRAAVYTQV